MDFVAALNQNAIINDADATAIKHTDLALGAEYPIKRMHKANTRYGEKLVVILPAEKGEKALFLPARYSRLDIDMKQYKPLSVVLIKHGQITVRGKITPLLMFKAARTEVSAAPAASAVSAAPAAPRSEVHNI